MRGLLRSRVALFAAVGVVAAGVAAALIVVSVTGGSSKAAPTTTAAGTGTTSSSTLSRVRETRKLFAGIQQHGNILGNPAAPVTMIEFADLQCPYCAEYATNALPGIIRDYVRPGKVKLAFEGIAFVGPDSEKALRAAYAAALQGHLWEVIDLLYRNQGRENTGWVTDDLLGEVGRSVNGLNGQAMLAALQTPPVDQAMAAASTQANSAHVNSTPTFFAGKTGQTLQPIQVSSLDTASFRPSLDALVG